MWKQFDVCACLFDSKQSFVSYACTEASHSSYVKLPIYLICTLLAVSRRAGMLGGLARISHHITMWMVIFRRRYSACGALQPSSLNLNIQRIAIQATEPPNIFTRSRSCISIPVNSSFAPEASESRYGPT